MFRVVINGLFATLAQMWSSLKSVSLLRYIVSTVYACVCAGAIATYVNSDPVWLIVNPFVTFLILMLISQLVVVVDFLFQRKRIDIISTCYFGLFIGFLLSVLLLQALNPLLEQSELRNAVVMLTTLTLPYLCVTLILQTKDDFRFVIPYVEFSKEVKGGKPVLIDSSSLIDGRVADVIETNILDAELIVPQFVLHEVQEIADSSDKIRRTRGRRGLEVLAKLQNNPHADVRMYETNDKDLKGSVDQRIVELAKLLGARIMTNDFNLNKVATVQGLGVINLNDVANALKPRYIPGERLTLRIIKEGEGQGQGVGYLDDGTMVVCEQASHLMNREIDIIVTSVLQSSAGRMIFGRQVHSVHDD